ncbi:hypothetical protein [Arenibaculum pallidiluteum]|uniref:hypothetical protein n=1 Tax=Arenibaculum pallidiluteum TaxID=2812559 RepID=UPI001A976A10|nr:hypothetical protein [Arenibaculum pallidiluteum]
MNIAWNFFEYGFFTFDGIHATNGVQLLWFLVILDIAAFAPTKTDMTIAVMVAVILLNAAVHYPLWRIGRLLARPGLGLALSAALLYVNVSGTAYLNGMEASLHLLILACLAATLLQAMQRARRSAMTGRDFGAVTFLLALSVWTRIDTAIFAAPLYLVLIWIYAGGTRTWHWPPVLASTALAGAMALTMLAAFQHMGGTLLPVSGLVKQSMFNEGFAANLPEVLAQVLKLTNPFLNEVAEAARAVQKRQPVAVEGLVLAAALGLPLLAGWLLLERRRSADGSGRRWRAAMAPLPGLCGLLALVTLPHLLYVASYPAYMVWYTSPYVLQVILATGLLIHRVAWLATEKPLRDAAAPAVAPVPAPAWPRPVAACMAAGIAAMSAWTLSRENLATAATNPATRWMVALQEERLEIARWIAEDLDRDIVAAAWNAGLLGYYGERRLINLDGLVNDARYLREVLPRQAEVLPGYLARNRVALVIDRTDYDYARLSGFEPVELPDRFRLMRMVRSMHLPAEALALEQLIAADDGG